MSSAEPVYRIEAETLAGKLKEVNRFPAHVQVARCETISIVNVSDAAFDSGLIQTGVMTGFAEDTYQALSIALTEYVERNVCRDNPAIPSANEGVAGRATYPGLAWKDAGRLAAQSALHEAIERFVWSTWWDDDRVGFELEKRHLQHENAKYAPLARHVVSLFPGSEFVCIRPRYEDRWNSMVVIVLLLLPGSQGVVSGGACGELERESQILFRALAELLRHAQCLHRSKTNTKIKPTCFYDERLLYFGSKPGVEVVRNRLTTASSSTLTMPDLQLDRVLHHSLESTVVLHQCRFVNQPEFLGGALERLCL